MRPLPPAVGAGGKRVSFNPVKGTRAPAPDVPDQAGRFGPFGGRYVPETLTRALDELAAEYAKARTDKAFQAELDDLLANYVGRPSPLYHARRLSQECGGAQIYLKREDLNHTGAHKINNTLGQALLTLRMGKPRVIAETGAGQHGVATATACARFGLQCVVYMGEEDIRRQQPNVFSMRLLGAEVRPVTSGSRTLRDAINEAMRDWMSSVETTHYILGSVVGPHPFPVDRARFSVGHRPRDDRAIARARSAGCPTWSWPASAAAATRPACSIRSSTSRAWSWWASKPAAVRRKPGDHASPLSYGRPGVLHGSYSYVMQDEDGQTCDVHSVSAGLDYPGVGPEHSYWKDTGRVTYTSCRDDDALAAFHTLARTEGILPALESSHAVAKAMELAKSRPTSDAIVVCLSGRGDKDAAEIARLRKKVKRVTGSPFGESEPFPFVPVFFISSFFTLSPSPPCPVSTNSSSNFAARAARR